MHRIQILLLIALLILAACEPDPPPTPRVDPLTGQEARGATFRAQTGAPPTETAAAIQTYLAIIGETLTPPPSPTRPERVVTRTMTPTVVVEMADDMLGNAYFTNDWLQAVFTATDGNTYSLDSLGAAVLIIHTFDPNCDFCYESHANLYGALLDFAVDEPIIVLNLNIDPAATIRAVTNWSTRYEFPMDADQGWYVGSASADLLRMLTETFGEPANNTLIVVDREQVSHIAQEVSYSVREWRQVLAFYIFGPTQEEVVETPSEE